MTVQPEFDGASPSFAAFTPELTPAVSTFGNTPNDPSSAAIRKLDANVANVSPALYAAGARTALTREEKNLIENWSGIKTTHEKLMRMRGSQAGEEFKKLEPGMQEVLKTYYNIDYENKPDNGAIIQNETFRKVLGLDDGLSVGDVIKSPFRFLMAAGAQYGKAINTAGNMLQNSIINRESFWTRANFDKSFDGKYLYDESISDELVNKYGGAESFVAMHVLAGDTPGEIIDAWGPNDTAILTAINSMFNEPEAFEVMLGEFSRAQLSPGRNIGRFVNNALGIKAEDNPKLFSLGTGAIDMAYQIFADPLTYLTLGGSVAAKAAGKAEKLAAAIKTGDDVPTYLARADVAPVFDSYTRGIGEYTKAKELGDTAEMNQAIARIQKASPAHGTIEEIEFWSGLGVTDLPSLVRQFDSDETGAFTKFVHGRTVDKTYASNGADHVKSSREFVMKAKERTREFFTGKVDYDETPIEYADLRPQLLSDNVSGVEIKAQKQQNFLQRFIQQQVQLHPGRAIVYHDDANVAKTADVFRKQAFLAFGRRDLAEVATMDFLRSGQADRFAMHRSIFELNMRRAGIHGMDGGEEFIKKSLDAHFGNKTTWEVLDNAPMPERFGLAQGRSIAATGPLHASQFKNYVTAPDWRAISEFAASRSLNKGDKKLVEYIPQVIGGAYNHRVTGIVTDLWTTLTLVPQLGIRTAIDEGFMFLMYANGALIKNYSAARKFNKIQASATGDLSAVGPIKNGIQVAIGRVLGREFGAVRDISQAERIDIRKGIEKANKKKSQWEIDELVRAELVDRAITRRAGRLDPVKQQWMRELIIDNPNVLRDVSSRNVNAAALGRADSMVTPVLLDRGQVDISMDALGVAPKGSIRAVDTRDMSDSDIDITMFDNMTRIFNDRGFTFKTKNGEDRTFSFGATFLRNNGIFNAEDFAKASSELMRNLGFIKNGEGRWIPAVDEADNIKTFINSTRFFDSYKDLADDADKMLEFVTAGLKDTYNAFHGGPLQYNPKLIKYFEEAMANGITDHRKILRTLTFDDYRGLIKGKRAEGRVMTDLDFDGVTTDLATWIREHGQDKAFDLMARQTDNIMRQPVVTMHYLAFREQYQAGELKMANDLYNSRVKQLESEGRVLNDKALDTIDRNAKEQAAKVFGNKAINDATQHVLKFSDNPAMQTVFAYNMRTVGRFYRAVEDFHRRMYRLTKDYPLQTIYRLRLMNQGFDAVGEVHTDPDGQPYVILPMDDVIYSAVDSTIRTLTGNTESMKQPLFSNITFNLTAGNPSFQTDAGMPYLSGPMASLSILTGKALLGKFDPTKNLAEDLDNTLMGSLGDNVTLYNAVTPKFARNIWSMLSTDEKSTQEVSALTQAISYNQANGYGINPKDPKYLLPDGSVDTALFEADKMEYLKNTRISAHNIIVTRALLGMVLPMSVQLKGNKDLPEYMLDSGVVSMQETFYEVLDQVKQKYPDASDPYEMALATWMGNNPGKIAYLVSKKSKEIQPILKFSSQMQDWTIKNQSAVNQYGAGALLFAPSNGEFSPGVWQWATAAGIAQNVDIDAYFNRVIMQEHVNAYYDLNTKEAAELKPLPFSFVAERRAVVDKYKQQRSLIKMQVPGLEEFMASGLDNTSAYEFANNAYNYAMSPDADIPQDIKLKVAQAYDIYSRFMKQAAYIDSLEAANGSDLKRAEKAAAEEAIKDLIRSDNTKTIEQYYNYGLSKLMNAKSRDGRAGINRNE